MQTGKQSINILLVEEDRPTAALIKDILTGLGFRHVYVASHMKRAIELMSSKKIDLMFTDWKFGEANCLELLKQVRHPDGHDPFIPIVVCAGYADLKSICSARDAGASDYIVRPFSMDFLSKRIASLIAESRQFVYTDDFFGPDRRKRSGAPPDGVDRRKRRE